MTGSYLPEKIYDNKYMESIVDTSDEWITERTGIKNRHIAKEDELTTDLAYKALKKVDQTKPEVEVPDTSVTYNYIIAGSLLAAGALAVTVVLKKRYSK